MQDKFVIFFSIMSIESRVQIVDFSRELGCLGLKESGICVNLPLQIKEEEGDYMGEDYEQFITDLRQWLRLNKGVLKEFCARNDVRDMNGSVVTNGSAYRMLAGALGVSLIRLYSWISQKIVPAEYMQRIKELMQRAEAGAGAEAASGEEIVEGESDTAGLPGEDADKSEVVEFIKSRLNYEGIGILYTEAASRGMRLEAFIESLLK